MTTREAIGAFWTYWATAKDTIAAAFEAGGLDEQHVQAISEHVASIDESLDWEFGPGKSSQHHLCVSAKGDPVLRIVAERWLSQAPAADATWEYYSSRQPHPGEGLALSIGGHEIHLDELKVAIAEDETRELLDVTLFHEAFAEIDDEELRVRVAFIGLDTLLGEDGVERWIGAIEVTTSEPADAVPIAELRKAVDKLAARATEDKWIVLEGRVDDRPIFVTLNAALKRINHLLLDTHVAITIELKQPTDDGLTESDEAETLNDMEDALLETLGNEAVYIGRETTAGVRVLHLHVMEGGPAARLIDNWRQRFRDYTITTSVAMDPRWDVLERWS